jgi:hypothetical protein
MGERDRGTPTMTAFYDVWYYVNGDSTEQTMSVAFPGGSEPSDEDIRVAVATWLMLNTAGYTDIVIMTWRYRVSV